MATPHVITPAFSSQEPKLSINTGVPNRRPAKHPPIRYSAERVAKLVEFSLFGSNPHIQRATGESLRALREISRGKRLPTAPVLRYFELRKSNSSYFWDID